MKGKPRNLFLIILMIIFFLILVSVGLSVFSATLVSVIFAVPTYFICFVLKVPAWVLSKCSYSRKKMCESRGEALEAAKEIAEEGIVLLKNEDSLLPLSGRGDQPCRINVFGRCSIQMFYNGSGSAASDISKCIPLVSAMEASGHFEVNQDLYNLQLNYINGEQISLDNKKDSRAVVKINRGGAEFLGKRPNLILQEFPTLLFETSTVYKDGRNAMAHAREFSEYALVVIGRGGAEGFELKAGDLQLSQGEQKLLDMICGQFDKVILLINTANPLELGVLKAYPQIKSVLWMGFLGTVGTVALAEILNGAVTPSGRLVDTWAKDSFAAPASHNFQILNQDGNWNEKSYHLDNYNEKQGYFLHYSENIYVGYRYFETRYLTDTSYQYEEEVMWPFGYGLSYTDFQQEIQKFEVISHVIYLTVRVKNIGDCEGKEVIQIYLNPPYSGRIEKAARNLITFAKTKTLLPGEEMICDFVLPFEELASFDSEMEKAYVLEVGNYEICLMKNAHEKITSRSYFLEKEIVYSNEKDGARSSDYVAATTCMRDTATRGKDLTREWEKDSNAFIGPLDECYHASENVLKALDSEVVTDAGAGFTELEMPHTGTKYPRKIMLDEMKGVSYEDKKWDEFIRQFSVGEMANLCGNGAWHTEKIKRLGINKKLMPDGSSGICSTLFSGIVMSNAGEGITYPCSVVVASTWNTQMAYAMGQSVGREAKALGYHGWYAPAMNCHRTPFNARNFEYYSEDGVLAGKIAAGVVRGAHAQGILCFLKHFALNERESSGRNQLLTYCNEQAIREIYLKPFEIAVKEGKARGIMTSFNYVGNHWAGACEPLLNQVLRQEWGFQGVVSTDACVYPHMDVKKMLVAGGDLSLDSFGGFVGGNVKRVELLKAAKNPVTQIVITKNLMRATKNILYSFLEVEHCAENHKRSTGN